MSGKPIPEAAVYVECRECRNCEHAGINDACATNAACHSCEWSGPSPTEDKCPGCGDSNCMGAACPKCGSLYRLIAEADVTLTAAQQQGQAVACVCCEDKPAPGNNPCGWCGRTAPPSAPVGAPPFEPTEAMHMAATGNVYRDGGSVAVWQAMYRAWQDSAAMEAALATQRQEPTP